MIQPIAGDPGLLKNSTNNSSDSPTKQFIIGGAKLITTSNMPRHILQRKQVEKLNKNKLINQDKENNF